MSETKVTMGMLKNSITLILAIVIALSGVFIAWGTLTQKIATVQADYAALEIRVDKGNSTLIEIQVQLAEIQRDILYIREKLAEREGKG